MKSTLVIARYKEDISWSDGHPRVVIQKGEDLPNKGREPSSYLHFIISRYSTLEGTFLFTQGTPFDHCKNVLTELYTPFSDFLWLGDKTYTENLYGRPNDTCNTDWFIKVANLVYDKDEIRFKAGCIFKVTAERIKQRPLEFYKNMYDVLMSEKHRSPWSFERCVGLIFGDNDGM